MRVVTKEYITFHELFTYTILKKKYKRWGDYHWKKIYGFIGKYKNKENI